jgi:hypothetical protein
MQRSRRDLSCFFIKARMSSFHLTEDGMEDYLYLLTSAS